MVDLQEKFYKNISLPSRLQASINTTDKKNTENEEMPTVVHMQRAWYTSRITDLQYRINR